MLEFAKKFLELQENFTSDFFQFMFKSLLQPLILCLSGDEHVISILFQERR